MQAGDPLQRHAVTVSGRPDAGATIVFVHGFGTDQTAWKDVAAAFADRFRIVTYDHAGAGKSAPGAFAQYRYLTLKSYASDLLEVCDALALDEAIVVGHSIGGMVALLAALERPALISRLVLLCASPHYLNDGDYHGGFSADALNDLYSAVMQSYPEWADAFASQMMANPDRPDLALAFADTLKAIPPSQSLTVLCSIFQSDHRAELPKLDKPVLLVQSRRDLAVPLEVAGYMNGRIKGSVLKVIDADGHLPHVCEPARVVAAMRDFVDAGGAVPA